MICEMRAGSADGADLCSPGRHDDDPAAVLPVLRHGLPRTLRMCAFACKFPASRRGLHSQLLLMLAATALEGS